MSGNNQSEIGYFHERAVRDMNANSHPLARIAYTALDKVFKTRQGKQQKTPIAKAQKTSPAPKFKPTV